MQICLPVKGAIKMMDVVLLSGARLPASMSHFKTATLGLVQRNSSQERMLLVEKSLQLCRLTGGQCGPFVEPIECRDTN
jgi:hypothetical protein